MKHVLCIDLSHAMPTDAGSDWMPEWEIHVVASLAAAQRAMRSRYYVVGLLLHDGREDSAAIAGFLREHGALQWVGVFDPHDLGRASCRDLIVEHLCDYHTLPIDPVRLRYTLGHAYGWAMLRHHSGTGRPQTRSPASPLVGDGHAMTRLQAQVARVARVAAPVLIWGESGSGKELTAQAIHAQSTRAAGPFVAINCGAIAPGLIHSELFGYERGAFTGATRSKVGLIESAHGGTLFLDEIADLPKELQANLLRFLQEKTICRLGSTVTVQVDVRIVAASHVRLQHAVAAGAFREDLYYRLAVLPVDVPALRERREDLLALADHVFQLHAGEKSARLCGFSQQALQAMRDHQWPGNVRELINRIRCAMVMSDARLITPADLGLEAAQAGAGTAALDDSRERGEHSTLRDCLDRSGQNISLAARELGISRTTIYRLLHKHGMRS